MARILYITTNLTGILNASFEVVSILEKAGHKVIFACPWDVQDSVIERGFDYCQLTPVNFKPAPETPAFQRGFGSWKKVRHLWTQRKKRREEALAALGMDQFRKILQENGPDIILIDLELHDYIITAVSQRIPVVLINQFFSIWKGPNLPPIFQDTIPGEGWRGHRLGISWAWFKVQAIQLYTVWKIRLLSGFSDRRSILRSYARRVGFPLQEFNELLRFPPPMTYRSLPVINLTSWELEFPHKPRRNHYYVGGMVDLNRQESSLDPAAETKLNQMLVDKRKRGFKLIYFSVSTMDAGDQAFIKRVIEAVSSRPDWQLIVGLGGLLTDEVIEDIPENILPLKWAPQLRILQHADCSINHGGIHSINECIQFGVPMIVYSGKMNDQNGNAARIAFHGLGMMADKDVDDVQTIQKRIDRILSDPSFKSRVLDIKEDSLRLKATLTDVIEGLVDQ